jgi:hypothetical protein
MDHDLGLMLGHHGLKVIEITYVTDDGAHPPDAFCPLADACHLEQAGLGGGREGIAYDVCA